jgi:TPR repeat protein
VDPRLRPQPRRRLLARVQLRRAEAADGDPTPALRVEERSCALCEQRVASAERYLRNTLGQSTRYWYSTWDGTGRAHERLRVACSSGEGRGCMAFADAYVDGLGLPQSKEKARELLRKICDGGHGASCVHLGDLERENGLSDAAQQAERSWRRACELRDGDGCHRLARLAIARGSPKDALPLYERGCTLRAPAACQDLGRLYLDGNGVARDPARGAALVEKGCRFGGAGCATGHAAAALP